MEDVRNSVEKARRWSQALKGKVVETKQKKYLTWHKWGRESKDLDLQTFSEKFEYEWKRVAQNNMELYGVLRPWKRLTNGKYVLNLGVNGRW